MKTSPLPAREEGTHKRTFEIYNVKGSEADRAQDA